MKHILLSHDFFPEIGGAHTWMYEVYRRWPEDVLVIARDYSHDRALGDRQKAFDRKSHGALTIVRQKMELADISFFSLTCLRHFYQMAKSIHRLVNDEICIIHTLRSFPEGIAAGVYKYLFNKKCKIVTYVHGEELQVAATSRQLKWLAKRVLAISDLVIVNSRSTLKMTRQFSKNTTPVVIHPGVEAARFCVSAAARQHQRTRWGIPDTAIVLTTIARLEPRKNHAMVLRALQVLEKQGISVFYVIGSQGEEKQHLLALADELNIRDRVIFTGYLSLEEKILTYGAADIHIMPSIIIGPMVEGFGIVFLEAAAMGIPSIAGDSGGQPEAVRSGKTGIIVDGTKLDPVVDAIRELATDKRVYEQMGRAARFWAKDNDWERVTQKTIDAVHTITHEV